MQTYPLAQRKDCEMCEGTCERYRESHVSLSYMVKQAGLSTPVLGEVLTNLAPLRRQYKCERACVP